MSFGARLAQKRLEKGLTQAALGAAVFTHGKKPSKSVVYGWEKDQHYPRVDQLMLICDKLNCSADYLLNGIASSLPFSRDVLIRINEMTKPALLTLENVMRAHLELPAIPLTVDRVGQEVTTTTTADKVTAPVDLNRGEVDLKEANRASNTDVEVPKSGRRGKT